MAAAKRDPNRVPTLIGVSNADFSTPILVGVDLATNRLLTNSLTTIVPPTNFEGGPVTIGTNVVEVTFTGTPKAVSIQSDPDNTGKIWIGKSNVTNAGANAMKELLPGQSFDFDYNDASDAIYAISDTASQNVFKFATL